MTLTRPVRLVPCTPATQSAPSLRWWFDKVPEIREARSSCSTFSAMASAERSTSVSSLCGAPRKPSGYSSAMKAVVISPDWNRGCSMTADRNGRLCPIPSSSKLSSARCIVWIASARVGAQAQSLAIIGS